MHNSHRLTVFFLSAALLLVISASIGLPAAAQEAGTSTVRGIVVAGHSGDPLPGATVALRQPADSSLVQGTTTDSTGQFVLRAVPAGSHRLVARFVGFKPQSRLLEVTAGATTLRPLHLSESPAEMEGVDVVAERALMTTKGSATIYNFQKAQVNLSSKSAADVLRDLPSVRVDRDGAVSLRGSDNVKVHVNGKPVPLSGQALVQYMRSLSAQNIARVEVNTNPSARYDPEGTAGIINIVLNRTRAVGWSGGLSASGGTNENASASGNLGYQNGPWTLNGSYSYNRSAMDVVQTLLRRGLDRATVLLDQTSDLDALRQGHSFTAQVDYQLTPQTTLSLTSMGNVQGMGFDRTASITGSGFAPSDPAQRVVDTDNDNLHLDERLSATHQFGSKEHTLSADVRYQWSDQRQQFEEEEALPRSIRERGIDDQFEDDASLNVDYTRPIGAWTLETGYMGSYRQLERDYDLLRWNGVRFTSAPERSSAFDFSETIHAGYSTLQRSVGPINAEVGLRLEHAATTINPRDQDATESQYVALYPSASLTYPVSKARRFTLSYAKRVNRPSARQLSVAGFLDDPYMRFEGNPRLDPEKVHTIELTAMQHAGPATITLSPYVRRTVDAIDWRTRIVSDSLTVRTFDNYQASTSFGVELATSMQFSKTVQASVSGNAYRMQTNGQNFESDLTRDAFAFMGRANVRWTVRPGLRLQVSQFYRSPIDHGLGHMDAFYRTEASIEQSFLDDRATVGLRVSDPFDTSDMGFEQTSTSFREWTTQNWQGRYLSLSLSYQFGNPDNKTRQRKPQQQGGGMGIMGGS
jgi:outer membrane receptor for ferrienterochelin and colicin